MEYLTRLLQAIMKIIVISLKYNNNNNYTIGHDYKYFI